MDQAIGAGAVIFVATLDPDTGSFADQGAVALPVVGAVVSVLAIVTAARLNR